MARKRYSVIICILVALFFVIPAGSEQKSAVEITAGEEWTWKKGENNIFSGKIDLSEFAGKEITVALSCDLPFSVEEKKESSPVFTIVNGKRIPMLKQTGIFQCAPDSANPVIEFSGKFRLPEKERVNRIMFIFSVMDESGQEIMNKEAFISNGTDQNGNAFYIPADINQITMLILLAAAIAWTAVLIRSKYKNNRE